MQHYVEEALRLQPAVYGTARRAKSDLHIKDGNKDHHVKKGQYVWVDIVSANLDPDHFPKPEEVHDNRDIKHYTFNEKVSSLTNSALHRFRLRFVSLMLLHSQRVASRSTRRSSPA